MSSKPEIVKNLMGGNEETTTGVVRLKAMERAGALKFPMFDVNDAQMKHLLITVMAQARAHLTAL